MEDNPNVRDIETLKEKVEVDKNNFWLGNCEHKTVVLALPPKTKSWLNKKEDLF